MKYLKFFCVFVAVGQSCRIQMTAVFVKLLQKTFSSLLLSGGEI